MIWPDLPALVGRGAEIAVLDRLLAVVAAGRSQVLVLRGEAGVGKTVLLAHLRGAGSKMRVVGVTGVESEIDLPFAGLYGAMRSMLADVDRLPVAQQDALATAFGSGNGEVASQRFLVGLAALSLLSRASEETPVLALVDDFQSIGPASAEALVFAARRLEAEAVGFVFAVREGTEQSRLLAGLPELRVGPLAESDARALLADTVRSGLDPRVADRIVAEALGNPLALLELPAELTPAQLADESLLPQTLPLGHRLVESLLRRVRSLPEETQTLLLLAAAEPSGDAALLWQAAALLGLSTQAAAPAEAQGLLSFNGQVSFRHPLIRSAVYESASSAERRQAHKGLADALDPQADADRRAWHRGAATLGFDDDVAAELDQASSRARQRGGYAAAAKLLVRAAQLTRDRETRARRTIAAAEAELAAGAPDRAIALLASGELTLVDPLQQALVQRLRGTLALASGDNSRSVQLLFGAAQALEPLDLRQARDTYLQSLEAALYAGTLGSRGTVLTIAQAARAAAPIRQAQTMPADGLLDGLAALFTDGPAAGLPLLGQPVEALRHVPDVRWAALAYQVATDLWDDTAVHALATERVETARQLGALTALPSALAQLGAYEVLVGRLDVAEACYREAREIAAATGSPGLMGDADPGALQVAAWRGDEGMTRLLAAACMRDANARGVGILVSFAEHALVTLEIGLSHYHAALVAAQDASTDQWLRLRTLPDLIEAAARTGETSLATAAIRDLADATLTSGSDWALGILARARALNTDADDADRLYKTSITHLQQSRVMPQLARSRLLYGEWLRRHRRRQDARIQLRSAYNAFAVIGAEGFAYRAATELAATGEHLNRPIESGHVLTQRELLIAQLAATGASNREIAAQLFISSRTVEYHLGRIYMKLNIASRTQLGRYLGEHGLDVRTDEG